MTTFNWNIRVYLYSYSYVLYSYSVQNIAVYVYSNLLAVFFISYGIYCKNLPRHVPIPVCALWTRALWPARRLCFKHSPIVYCIVYTELYYKKKTLSNLSTIYWKFCSCLINNNHMDYMKSTSTDTPSK